MNEGVRVGRRPGTGPQLMPSTTRRGSLLALAVLAVGTSGIDHEPPPTNPAVAPRPRDAEWLARHEALVAKAGQGGVDLVFLGDSITEFWAYHAPATWAEYYGPRRALNLGIGGDQTQHVLWRVDHGELDGIEPKVVVLMVGTNNLPEQPEGQVVEGVRAVVDRVRGKLPRSKILLLGLTPRGVGPQDLGRIAIEPDPRVARINAKLAGLADGRVVRFLDFGPKLLDDQGRVIRAIEPDFLHPNHLGYRIWAGAMEPTLREMMAGR